MVVRPPTDRFKDFAMLLAERLARPHLVQLSPAVTLAELGLDSLAMLELLVALEELGAVRYDELLDLATQTADLHRLSLGQLYGQFIIAGPGTAEDAEEAP